MSGRAVGMIGGPLDGESRHLNSRMREQTLLYKDGDWSTGVKEVHVYRSLGGRAPFRYEGTRPCVENVDVVVSKDCATMTGPPTRWLGIAFGNLRDRC